MARNFLLLIAFFAPIFSSEEFIIWAKISTHNNQIYYENLSISSAMVLSDIEYKKICELNFVKKSTQSTIEYLNEHKNELFECFAGSNFKVEDNSISGINPNTNTTITMFPLRFMIEFKQNLAIISVFSK